MQILTIVGARPQFVKAAVLSREIRDRGWREMLVHTGQHYDQQLSGVFFEELSLPTPDFNLAIGSGSHGEQTGRMLAAIERVLIDARPDWVVVFGDTNSTLAGALAAAKLNLPVAHVEAGLRSLNRSMPEEVNRVVTDHVSDLLLAPSHDAVRHLQHEGIAERKIHLVGDVMYDATLHFREIAATRSNILDRLRLSSKNFVLVTVHRAENTDNQLRLRSIVNGLVEVAQSRPVVLPMHPRTKAVLQRFELWTQVTESLTTTEPVGYLDMTMLEAHAERIITDSGGVQKEAYFCNTPCVTLRDETEWGELVESGWNQLVSPDNPDFSHHLLDAVARSAPTSCRTSFYGTGNARGLICDCLEQRPLSTANFPVTLFNEHYL